MTTSLNTSVPARDASYQLIHFLRKSIDPSTTPTGTVVTVGTIPAYAAVLGGLSGVYHVTNLTGGGSTNAVDIGYATDSLASADADAYATALGLLTTTAGFVAVDELATATGRPRSVPTTITATWTGSATTGTFDVVIAYVPNY